MKKNLLIAIVVFVFTLVISLIISDVIKKDNQKADQHYSVVK